MSYYTNIRLDWNISFYTIVWIKQPWEPQCYYPDFPHEVVCGDSWGEARLMLATHEGGVYILDGEYS